MDEEFSTIRGFGGGKVAAFESRMGTEMEKFIIRHGGTPLVAPSMQEIPLENNTKALEFGEELLADRIDWVICLTGVGTKTLLEVMRTKWDMVQIGQALGRCAIVARGPKSVMALKEVGLIPSVLVPEPNTWEDLIRAIDEFQPKGLTGLTVAVQEYGVTNLELITALKNRGAKVCQVPVYRWALPDQVEPLQQVLSAIIRGQVPVALFTNAAQVDHVMTVLTQGQQVDPFRQAMSHMMVGSIGKITTDRLKHHGFSVDLEPSHPKMGILVKEASQQASAILTEKRG